MFLNYCKIGWRSIIRHKSFSAINIAGLALSITAFILMALYIESELNYDGFNEKANRIYRVVDDKKTPDLLLRSASSAAPVAPALKAEFPEIREAVRIISAESLIACKDKLFEERNIFFADASIFNVFSFKLHTGNPQTVLLEPATIVITESMAKKYFGDLEGVGKVLSVDGKPMRVTGVVEDPPLASHFRFDFLISMSTAETKGQVTIGYLPIGIPIIFIPIYSFLRSMMLKSLLRACQILTAGTMKKMAVPFTSMIWKS